MTPTTPEGLRALHADAIAVVTAVRAGDGEAFHLVLRDYTGADGEPTTIDLITALANQVVSLAERAGSVHGLSGERYLGVFAVALAAA